MLRAVGSCRSLSTNALRRAVRAYATTASVPNYDDVLKRHSERKNMSRDDILNVIRKNTLFSWGASEASANGAIVVTKAEGVYFWDHDKRYIDFNSQAMCSNLGHTVPQEVKDEIANQLNTVAYSYPCATVTKIKAELSALLADICPGDLNHFYYSSGGAEANETAMRVARLYTGRHKILSRYRSYHGGTLGTMALTGDPRRFYSEPHSAPGVVHFMDPYPYSFQWGTTEEEISHRSLQILKETLMYEGPKNVAAIFVESVTGTNGVLKAPKGYLEGVRALCNEHGILMVCDEVMNGFGRTGKMFGFMHTEPEIIPDIVSMAKGVNGAYLPLGVNAFRDHIAEHFKKNPIGIGSTYNSHPVTLASAYGSLKYLLKNKVLENVIKLEPLMKSLQQDLKAKHPCVKSARSIGLFGMIDLQKNTKGDPFVTYNGPASPAIAKFQNELRSRGLYTLIRWSGFFTNPPLIINESQLREGFAIIDAALTILDENMKSE